MSKPTYAALLFLLLFSLSRSRTAAQAINGFEVISTAQGLSQGLINDMLQDHEGFIWIATKGGLSRYDGYTFKTFVTDPQDNSSISSNAVSNLLEDRSGRIWAGTYDGGVNVYDKRSGHFLRINQQPGKASGLSGNRIYSEILGLPDGRVLLYPEGGKLSIIALANTGQPVITTVNAPANRTIIGITKDEKGFIWVGFSDYCLYIFDPAILSFEQLFDGQHFTSLIEKTGKHISAKFSQTLSLSPIPDTRQELINATGQLNTGMVSIEKDGGLLLGGRFPLKTGASGCNYYDFSGIKAGDKMEKVYARNLMTSVKDQNIKCLLLDRSGLLWIGMMGHGIYKYHIKNDRFSPVLSNMSIQRTTVWNNNKIYIQGWRNSMLISAEGEVQVNPVASLVHEAPAYTTVLQTKTGDYWLYWNGQKKVFRYSADLKLAAVYDEPVNSSPTEQLQPFLEDRKGNIWICGANGTFARIVPSTGKISQFSVDMGLYTGMSGLVQTTAFYEDMQGFFWLGTEHGFARLKFEEGTTSPQVKWYKNIPGNTNSLSYNYVSWFMEDAANNDFLWVSTKGGGLNRLQKSTGNFIHYNTKQGLPNDVVYGTLTDNAGNIWGSTNRGLFCMLAGSKKNNAAPEFRLLSTSDGLQADEFNTNAFCKLGNGNLVFGGVNGLNIFNPQKVLASSFTPNVFITGIQIGNKMLAPGDQTGVLKETIENTQSITLNYLQDVVTLEFSSLDLTEPQKNKYRYQLVGIDKEWIESGTRRTATYLHLPSGTYVFKVQGSNSQGIWSDQIAELKIKILPPWWLSWWAYVIYALLIALAIRAYVKFNINKARLRSQLNYEQLEAKKVKELDAVKTQLYTNITHEFRTPLTVILGMAQQVIENPDVQFDTRMDMIVRNGRSLLNLVNQMLDLSKLETGKMQLELSNGNIIHFLGYVVESFQSLAESQQKQLHFLTDIDTLYMEYDREKLRQIVSNLLSNAIKFTPEKGNIYISVTENTASSALVIKVKDTGIGIAEDQLPYIFDRFYQLDNSHTNKTEGTGIGLALTKELVKLMGGEIVVKSPPTGAGKGSEFTVTLALRKVEAADETPSGDIQSAASPMPARVVMPEENANSNAPLILLVEDNADVVAYTASCLPEYRLVVGKDGREGFDIATEMIPDLIITDVMMPLMDGFELTEKLRGNENTSHIPVIILTAKADISSKIEGLQQGADAYLEKPFNKNELLVRVRKLLEMRKNLQQYYLNKAGINGEVATAVPPKTEVPLIEDSFVKKVREAVEQNLSDASFSVEKLARLVFMSHSQLHRKLEALTGYSPNKFIRMARLEKARELLRDQANSIASVAMDCGYDDPGYFARVFKQEYGVTPQKWRGG